MSNLVINSESLTSIADSIRNKTGNSEKLIFPEQFISSINSIQSGGSNTGIKFQKGNNTTYKSGNFVINNLSFNPLLVIYAIETTYDGENHTIYSAAFNNQSLTDNAQSFTFEGRVGHFIRVHKAKAIFETNKVSLMLFEESGKGTVNSISWWAFGNFNI